MVQRLSDFKLPRNFRGRNDFTVQLWWLVQSFLINTSPQFMYAWRRFVLRLFGCQIGRDVIIRPSVKITFPWKVKIGDYSWIGDNVELYSLGNITIGQNVVISQKSYLCTGSHDYSNEKFEIFCKNISIEDEVWVASDVYIGPGVNINKGNVIGARSSVFTPIDDTYGVYIGSPVRKIKNRK